MSDLELPNHGSRILERLDFLNTDELAELENDPNAAVDQDAAGSDVEVLDNSFISSLIRRFTMLEKGLCNKTRAKRMVVRTVFSSCSKKGN